MKFNKPAAVIAASISIALSIYQYLLLINLLERLARLLPGMKGFLNMFLIIASGVAELAFIYTRYHSYHKSSQQKRLMRRALGVTLVQLYVLVAFVPIRLVLLAGAFGIPMTTDVLTSGSPMDAMIFSVALAASGVCHALLSLARAKDKV